MKYLENRPIRKKGFYRAVKRNEDWALRIHNMEEGVNKLLAFLYRYVDISELVLKDNPFLSLIKKDPCDGEKYTPVPIICGSKK